MDQPDIILKEAIENHQNMIKQFKGTYVPTTKELLIAWIKSAEELPLWQDFVPAGNLSLREVKTL